MENLSINDNPPQGGQAPPLGPAAHGLPQPPPQLPPQMFTTAAQLLDLTDSTMRSLFFFRRKNTWVLTQDRLREANGSFARRQETDWYIA